MKLALILMIKNEEKILLRCLKALENIVEYFCICDTGSTDTTLQIAKEFLETHKGCLTEEPFQNFGYNRSVSFNNAQKYLDESKVNLKETYGLLLDADMLFIPGKLLEQDLKETGYKVIQINGGMEYYNARILRMDIVWKCIGVTHEYWDGPCNSTLTKDICYIDDRGDGGCKHDKFERDQRLLEEGLSKEPQNVRYMFYLAQTYKCLGKFEDAIQMYKKRIEAGGWDEEVWYSHYMIGESYFSLNNIPEFENWMQKAFAYRPTRSESIYKLAKYFREVAHHYKSYHYIRIGEKIPFTKDILFIESDFYKGLFEYEKSIVEYYIHPERCLKTTINYMLQLGHFQDNCVSNLKFSVKPLKSKITKLVLPSPFGEDFTPSAISLDTYPLANVRYVNYKIQPDGSYVMPDGIVVTKNAYVNLESGEFSAMEEPLVNFESHIRGLEDLRLYKNSNGKLCFTATSFKQFIQDKISIVHGEYDLETNSYKNYQGIQSPTNSDCEKNWVNIPGTDDFIYSWNPLRIGRIKENKFIFTFESNTPPLFSLFRGSASPIEVNGQWLVLVHFVEYCQPRKYYHCFVELEKETYKVLKVSLPFVFQSIGIEYCISGRLIEDTLEYYFSSWDKNSSKIEFKVSEIEWITLNQPSPKKLKDSKSTIVSTFFNLKKLPDSTDSVRPLEFYLEHGKKTLELPYPMVLFCDEETRPLLEKIRGELPTTYIEKNITEYDYFKELYPKVVENRKVIPSPDPRNTSSYFLTSLFKILALNLAKEGNHYPDTSHYFWIDLGGSHVMRGFPDAVHKILDNPRSKISCGYIHYRSDSELYPMKEFMKNGGKCCIGSGCFSIETSYVERFYEDIFQILNEQISLGVGHAEEQCIVYSYSKNPEWFNLYFADYYSLVTNYHETIEDIQCVQNNFINIARSVGRTDLVELASNSIKK